MLPYLKFVGRGDQVLIEDCVTRLEPLLKKAIASNPELTDAEQEECLTLIKRLETSMQHTTHPSDEVKNEPVPAAAMEALTLSFDVDWDNKESLVKLRKEISTVYATLSQFSFGDETDNNTIRVNMKYLLPLLDKAIDDVDNEEPPQARDFRNSELRRVADVLEQVIFKPALSRIHNK